MNSQANEFLNQKLAFANALFGGFNPFQNIPKKVYSQLRIAIHQHPYMVATHCNVNVKGRVKPPDTQRPLEGVSVSVRLLACWATYRWREPVRLYKLNGLHYNVSAMLLQMLQEFPPQWGRAGFLGVATAISCNWCAVSNTILAQGQLGSRPWNSDFASPTLASWHLEQR